MKPARRNHEGFKQGDGLWIDGYGTEERPNGHIKDYSVSSVWWRKDGYIKEFAPYQVDYILWVRETWRVGAWDGDTGSIAVDYKADGHVRKEWMQVADPERFEKYWIQSTDDAEKAGLRPNEDGQYHWDMGKAPTRWRPSIYMPREAARIFLRVTNVRVERLQDITEEDARKEGCMSGMITGTCNARGQFQDLWDSLNAKRGRGYGWDTNPWVWVIEFERVVKANE